MLSYELRNILIKLYLPIRLVLKFLKINYETFMKVSVNKFRQIYFTLNNLCRQETLGSILIKNSNILHYIREKIQFYQYFHFIS